MSLEHRRGSVRVAVVDSDGAPLRNTDVTLEQRSHAFAFGNIGFDFIPLANGESGEEQNRSESFGHASTESLAALGELWLDVFNTATLPFYWRGFEPVEGAPDTQRIRATAKWFVDRGIVVKGHPLTWHTLTPEWLNNRATADVETLQRERIRRDVSDFAGLIDMWDAINEVVIMPEFTAEENGISRLAASIGRVPMVRLAFEQARESNPSATLILNDFNLSSEYEQLIEDVLDAGVRIDAIGLQTHMHQGYWGEDVLLATVDRFARFGLPLHLTETTLVSGHVMPPEIVDLNDYQVTHWPTTPDGEARQADEVERHYRSLMSHPAVQAITYWGLTDDGAWLGAPAGLVRSDGTPKPSYDALRSLIKEEWWLPSTRVRTMDDGTLVLSGFYGEYTVAAEGRSATVALGRGSTDVVARLA